MVPLEKADAQTSYDSRHHFKMARILPASAVLLLLIGVTCAQSPKGCYTGDETTVSAEASSDDMTNEDCAADCGAKGHAYSATGEGQYCTCMSEAEMQTLTLAPSVKCDSPCTGDLAQKCGGVDDNVTVWSTGQGTKRSLVEKLRRFLKEWHQMEESRR
ncbi:Hypp9231 [Branchiostoma lanceolatum]|uniref:Hypp9231 protein n=1 Tax=Branchiostoma lanceolatum TaxID=7740 RepID=A0A8J9ZD29_BRALA|nr:Hypp9231 [Branchiostoma lanceolatum]